MPKALCLTSLAIAVLMLLLFGSDLVLQLAGMTSMAPLEGASLMMDAAFAVISIIIAVMSWFTFKEQV